MRSSGIYSGVTRDLRPKTAQGYRQLLKHDVLPRWGARPLADISKSDVLVLLHEKAVGRERKRGGAPHGAVVQANKLRTRLRTFFGWCIANDLITTDPTAGVRKPAREVTRDRVLSDDEIKRLWAASEGMLAKRRNAVPFRASAVPGDLVPILAKAEIVNSLGTLNLAGAKRRDRTVANEQPTPRE